MDDLVETLRIGQWASPLVSGVLAFFFGETAALILLGLAIAAVVAAAVTWLWLTRLRRTRRDRRGRDVPMRTSVREWGEAADVWSKVLLRLTLIGFGIAGGAVAGLELSPD